ncbi:MAG: tyrosine-type recombinase/integrase [Candidatus Zixiibacteriota bacterium]
MANVSFKDVCKVAEQMGMGSDLLESFSFACRVKNLTPSTLKCYAERLGYLVEYSGTIKKSMEDLTQKDIQSYLMRILDTVSAATVNGRIRVFKVFFKHLKSEGLIKVDPMVSISLMRAEQKVKPVLSSEEMSHVLAGLNRNTQYGARAYCMILLTYDAMLRLNELLSLRVENVDLHAKLVKVYGKGRKERFAPFSDRTAKTLHTYILKYRKGQPTDLLFATKNGHKIDPRRGHRIFSLAGKRAGLYLHPHLVRHSSASQFIRMGGNPAVLQKILGHSSLTVTQRYVHLSADDLNLAYERFSPVSQLVNVRSST